jgi:nitrous oxide reductase accessory protein NosL
MKIAVLAVCLAATLAAGCRREEAAPMYEPMKLGGAAESGQNEMSR